MDFCIPPSTTSVTLSVGIKGDFSKCASTFGNCVSVSSYGLFNREYILGYVEINTDQDDFIIHSEWDNKSIDDYYWTAGSSVQIEFSASSRVNYYTYEATLKCN